MKKTFILLFVSALLLSCQQKVSRDDIAKINGYWEIEKAELPDGDKKEYTINETVEYFTIKDNKGFREKVMPQLDGKYISDDLREAIQIVEKDGVFFINYSTRYAKWTEQILEVSDNTLVLKNLQNIEYHYKKPIPFSIK